MTGISGISFQETNSGLLVHVRKSNKSSSGKLRKRLPYNFKQMSKQIQQAKTANAARSLPTKMRAKLSWLYKQLRNGDYGANEVFAAIIHAASMERIAKRKLRHLEEEEAAENGSGAAANVPGEEEEIPGKDELQEAIEDSEEISEKRMKEMMEEIEELEEELASESLSEMQDMFSCAGRDMSEDEIKEMKRKHRDDEERQITRADLKYLKALFDRLEQEKRSATAANFRSQGTNNASNAATSVSYQVESLPEVEISDADMSSIRLSVQARCPVDIGVAIDVAV